MHGNSTTFEQKFWPKVNPDLNSGCWIWGGYIAPHGYANMRDEGKLRGAHVVAYEKLVGPIPDGLIIDHKCRVRCCVNPSHLEPVTYKENIRRSSIHSGAATHCRNGHPLDGETRGTLTSVKGSVWSAERLTLEGGIYVPVTRRYLCDDCNWEWTMFHVKHDEPFPECPNCAKADPANIPGMFSITGTKSKAVDYVQKMAEEDYGLSNMRDNTREGDIAAIAPPPVQEREAQALTMAMKEMAPDLSDAQAEQVRDFWKTGGSPSSMAQVAAPGAAAARQLGSDPIELLHKAEKATGRQRMKLDVVSRSKMN